MTETLRPTGPATSDRITLVAVDRYLDHLVDAVRGSSWGDALQFHGVDLLDAMRSPLFVELLAAARTPEPQAPHPGATRTWRDRLRRYAIDRQLPRPLLEWKSRRRSHRPPHGGVLLWPREPTHLRAMEPVCDELISRESGGPPVGYLVCQPRLFEPTERGGRVPVTLTRAEWPDLVRRVEASAPPILDTAEESIAAYLPQGAAIGLLPRRVEQILRRVLARQLPTLLESILATERIVDEFAPKVLVVGNDLTIEGRAAAHTAKLSGVPTVSLMHGAITADPLQRHHVVDRFLVYGEAHREELEELGLAPERIAVVGNPRLDDIPAPSRETDPRVAAVAGISPDQPWILVASSGPGHRTSLEHHRRFIAAIGQLAQSLSHARVVVKLHRKDRREHYPDSPPYALLEHGTPGAPTDIFDWLRGPSALVTGASTVAIEAMLMEVPVITVDLAGEFGGVDFVEASASHHTVTPTALIDLAGEVLKSDGAVQRAVTDFLDRSFFARGRSARTAVDALLGALTQTAAAEEHPPGEQP